MALCSPGSAAALWHDPTPIRIGVSSCLLGEAVRWDGGDKRDAFLCDVLGRYVEWVSVCPEVELGLEVPRDAMRLESRDGATRLVATKSGHDLSAAMLSFGVRRARELRRDALCGYVLKAKSPSCGLAQVRVWNERGRPEARGRGVFAEALLASDPTLPVEEEGRLRDPALRERFVERVFAAHRVRSLFSGRWTRARLVAFHAAHELQLMAHTQAGARGLGRLLERAKELDPSALRDRYLDGFTAALARPATRRGHATVLRHIQGYLRKRLDAGERREIENSIERYRDGLLPLIVPVTLLRHHALREGVVALADQVYLEPHPAELVLRNHV